MRRPRTWAIAGFVLAIAVTPLGSLLSGGVFETWLHAEYGRGPVRVLVHDQTGLVAGTATYSYAPQESDPGADQRLLLVPWSVCGNQADLTFSRKANGYAIAAPSTESGWCSWFTVATRGLTVLSLRALVDTATVDFEALDATR